ncbi:phage virion morphogenesis protein [Kingella negevensis]|uniref:phage virion morphogenesis protein n=1 Tax=Kingella negevensis TaxID=1522312 RepID=UPI00254B8EFF|nr:phage virion morphogenesis protein [Kingella negevensis]MDK4680405.1 phage virion morphogenesis protein [Kingella negevensis]MDK4681872.1 phage virion morphogenesis protein [Kingella negevensis]MDK4690069.1 phage virion morphogenesis protein [Kingella negevensis]MDK4692585.1 phage virion morphogenesis protein [Kingella negevensis]MDK4698884.1 phage virion morphogenesis protein [Kingella negevensis]
MLQISLDTSDFDRGMARLLQNVENHRPMMSSIAVELLSMSEDNFESESWGGQSWQQSKRAAKDGGKTLQLSGQLAASLTTQSGNDFARIGSNKPYAAIHHIGGQAGRGRKVHIPARPYLPIDGSGVLQSGGEKRLLDIVKASLARGL